MTPYTSNRKILEAYQKVYETANTDGTIDDVSKYDEILHDCAKQIIDGCLETLGAKLHYDRGRGIEQRTDRIVLYRINSSTLLEFPRFGNDKNDDYRIFESIEWWYGYAIKKHEELIEETYHALKENGGLIKLKRNMEYDELEYYLTKSIRINTHIGVFTLIVPAGRVGYEGEDGVSTFNSKARSGKSAAFRKNLSSPNFTDKRMTDNSEEEALGESARDVSYLEKNFYKMDGLREELVDIFHRDTGIVLGSSTLRERLRDACNQILEVLDAY